MNKWQGTAVIKRPPAISKRNGALFMTFLAVNTERSILTAGPPPPRELYITCYWANPPHDILQEFQAKSVIFVEGELFLERFTRNDGTRGMGVSLAIETGHFKWQAGLKGPYIPPSSAWRTIKKPLQE